MSTHVLLKPFYRQSTIRLVHSSNRDLRLSAVAPCDLRTTGLITNLVTSAVDTRSIGIDRLADLQTVLFESFVDLVESVEAEDVHVVVNRTDGGMTVRLAAVDPEWTGAPSFLVQRVLTALADRVETGEGAIEFEFLT
jgi:hypothetical protein